MGLLEKGGGREGGRLVILLLNTPLVPVTSHYLNHVGSTGAKSVPSATIVRVLGGEVRVWYLALMKCSCTCSGCSQAPSHGWRGPRDPEHLFGCIFLA